jgi:DNA gyrase subunit A
MAGIISVEDDDDVMMITDSGIIIRTPAEDISTYSRTAAGVIVMRLEKGQKLVNVTKVAKEEESEENSEENESEAIADGEIIIEPVETEQE